MASVIAVKSSALHLADGREQEKPNKAWLSDAEYRARERKRVVLIASPVGALRNFVEWEDA
jgi:hypothetical protein